MAFKVKDLLINIAPSETANPGTWGVPFGLECRWSTTALISWVSRNFTCTYPCPPVGPGFASATGLLSPEQLAALKSQLREALTEIENQEKIITESLQPKTLAEIETLE